MQYRSDFDFHFYLIIYEFWRFLPPFFQKEASSESAKKHLTLKKKKHFWGTDADNECDLMLFWPLLFLGENVQIP